MESKKCLSVLHDRNSSSYFAADGKVFTAVQVPLGFFFRNNVVYNWFSLSSCPLKYGSPNKHFSLYKYEQAVGSCKDIIGVTLVSRKVSVQNRPTLRDSVRSFPAPTLLECPFPRTTWVRLGHLRTGVERFRSCLHKWVMVSLCGLWVWRRTNLWPCCPSVSHPSTSPWTARPDTSGWDNGCSTPVPRSRAAKQWIERIDSNDKEHNGPISSGVASPNFVGENIWF